jgi:hypothetical protein
MLGSRTSTRIGDEINLGKRQASDRHSIEHGLKMYASIIILLA